MAKNVFEPNVALFHNRAADIPLPSKLNQCFWGKPLKDWKKLCNVLLLMSLYRQILPPVLFSSLSFSLSSLLILFFFLSTNRQKSHLHWVIAYLKEINQKLGMYYTCCILQLWWVEMCQLYSLSTAVVSQIFL